MLTTKELAVKEKLENLVPSLEKFFAEKNPKQFEEWNKNCCLQTAFLCAYVLKNDLPEYKWFIQEGMFHNGRGLYNHGYVVGIGKDKNLLVDLARHPVWDDLFIEVNDVDNPYAGTNIKDQRISVKDYDYSWMLEENEYFTKLKGRKFLRECIKYADGR